MRINSKTNNNTNKVTDQELLNIIKSEFYRIKPKGCWDFLKNANNVPCLQTLKKRFNRTYNEILILAGVPEEELNFVRRSKDEYLEKLKLVANKLGHTPSAKEFEENGYCYSMLAKFYGSYNNAIKVAGLKPKPSPRIVTCSKNQLKASYMFLSRKIGKIASYDDLNYYSTVNAGSYCIRFGGMKGLKKSLGIKPSSNGPKEKYSKDILVQLMIEESKKLSRRLTVEEISENSNLPCYTTILKYFNTTKISNVWQEVYNKMLEQNNTIKSINSSQISVERSKIIEAGKNGEDIVSHELDFLSKSEYIVYNNINLYSNGRSQQIDHLVLGRNGIFSIETKNLTGKILIDIDKTWCQTKKVGSTCTTYRVENPTGQALRHETIIREILNDKYKITNLIVMANKKVTLQGADRNPVKIIMSDMIHSHIKNYKPTMLLDKQDIENARCLIESSIVSKNDSIDCAS